MITIYVAIHDARRLIHVCCFSSLMLCLCCMLRESYTSRCDTITICMQQQRSCMLVLRAAQHKHKEREGLEYNRRAVFENRWESLHIWAKACLRSGPEVQNFLSMAVTWFFKVLTVSCGQLYLNLAHCVPNWKKSECYTSKKLSRRRCSGRRGFPPA